MIRMNRSISWRVPEALDEFQSAVGQQIFARLLTVELRSRSWRKSIMRLPFIIVSALVFVCLTGGIQRKSYIGSLISLDGGRLAERDGRLILLTGRGGIVPRMDGVSLCGEWRVGTPYLESGGKFLTLEQTEQGIDLSLGPKGDSARWVIEVLQIKSLKSDGKNREGNSGAVFRLRVFDGRYKGWYLAATELNKEQLNSPLNAPLVREFRVVEDPKMALSFDYVDTSYSVHHK